MVKPWSEDLMISYSLLPKSLEKYGIEAANALEDGLKNLFKGKDKNGEAKMGLYEKEKMKKEFDNKIIEQKKEDIRKKRGKEIKSKVEQYKKEKEEKERIKKELEEKKKEEEQEKNELTKNKNSNQNEIEDLKEQIKQNELKNKSQLDDCNKIDKKYNEF